MLAYQLSAYGGPAALVDIARPEPRADEVLLRIHACGLNFADLLMIKGEYQEKPPLPMIMGLELAGEITALGAHVRGWSVGERVAVMAGQGGLAQWGAFPADRLVKLPDSMPYDQAAGFLIAYGTSHLALHHRARLQAGETLLVTGASGGVGLTAVEIGKAMGARVIASARGADKLAVAKAAGADHLIDSDAQDLRTTVKALGGTDVVYDAIGGDTFMAALRATNPEGRLLPIGFAGGGVPQIPANLLLVKNLSVHGVYWGGYPKFRPQVITDTLNALFAMYEAGGLTPHVSHRFTLSEVEQGLEVLRSRQSTGKVVILTT